MNIKNQICNKIKELKQDFATPNYYSEEFLYLSKKFLEADNYGKMERSSRALMRNVLKYHGKNQEIGPVLENLLNFELDFDYEYYHDQKIHFWHLTNVFLLGLYIYHNLKIIRDSFTDYFEKDCESVKLIVENNHQILLKKDWQYSAKSIFGEFLYRWRLASLCHDIGTPFSQVGNNKNKINEMLKILNSISTIKLYDIDSFKNFQSKYLNCNLKKTENKELIYEPNEGFDNSTTILSHLDEMIDSISLRKYIENQKKNPYNKEVYYDHGIFGALLFIIKVEENFCVYDNDNIYEHDGGIWHPYLFKKSLMHSAKAIALHNLDQDISSLKLSIDTNNQKNLQIYDFEKDPLSWLLKISDTLQVWDKPTTLKLEENEKPEPTIFRIDFEGNNKIILESIPKIDEKLDTIKKFTKSPIKFSFK